MCVDGTRPLGASEVDRPELICLLKKLKIKVVLPQVEDVWLCLRIPERVSDLYPESRTMHSDFYYSFRPLKAFSQLS